MLADHRKSELGYHEKLNIFVEIFGTKKHLDQTDHREGGGPDAGEGPLTQCNYCASSHRLRHSYNCQFRVASAHGERETANLREGELGKIESCHYKGGGAQRCWPSEHW